MGDVENISRPACCQEPWQWDHCPGWGLVAETGHPEHSWQDPEELALIVKLLKPSPPGRKQMQKLCGCQAATSI